jgi:hypothetical protein
LWRNNASNNAGVHCVIVGVKKGTAGLKRIYEGDIVRDVASISPYLIPGEERFIEAEDSQISGILPNMNSGNMARDGGHLILSEEEASDLRRKWPGSDRFIRRLIGTKEINQGSHRYCLWIDDDQADLAKQIPEIADRIERVRQMRSASPAKTTKGYAKTPYKFAQRCHRDEPCIAVPKTTTGESMYLTPTIYEGDAVITDLAFVMYPMDLVSFAIISSSLHLVWTKTVSGGMRAGLRYSSQLAYHTFPVPFLTEKNRADLSGSAEDILLARESHFPGTIADLYDQNHMPAGLRHAHDRNDEVLERIYIGRRFRNDTERLEKLFDLYTKMTASAALAKKQ